ncbi:hypothetical protein ILYODFUR_003661 [Ilyodon furcidens]|uniref:Uncharacterized protein n=1 Tax=Ilyodon furcidens TaxID=33524 RepID=A0ABV0VCD2_9TELE
MSPCEIYNDRKIDEKQELSKKINDIITNRCPGVFLSSNRILILSLLHLLLCFGQHPKLMVIIITVMLHRLCWYRREGAAWHWLSEHCSCLTKLAASYALERSRVAPIKGGHESTEGVG